MIDIVMTISINKKYKHFIDPQVGDRIYIIEDSDYRDIVLTKEHVENGFINKIIPGAFMGVYIDFDHGVSLLRNIGGKLMSVMNHGEEFSVTIMVDNDMYIGKNTKIKDAFYEALLQVPDKVLETYDRRS